MSGSMSDDYYSNPPSVASVSSTSCMIKNQTKSMLRLEMTKKGQVEVKCGNMVWDRLHPSTRDEIELVMEQCKEGDSTEPNGRGQQMYKEVKNFFSSSHHEPKVKELRGSIPKAVLVLYYLDEVVQGREKIRDMWAKEKRPRNWPAHLPYNDPNNGPKYQNPNSARKLHKEELLKVYRHLRSEFLAKKSQIEGRLGVSLPEPVQESTEVQKVVNALHVAQRDVKMKLESQLTYTCLRDLLGLLDTLKASIESDQIRVLDAAHAAQRLILEMDLKDMGEAHVNATCQSIKARFEGRELRTVQPTSTEDGHPYISTIEEKAAVVPLLDERSSSTLAVSNGVMWQQTSADLLEAAVADLPSAKDDDDGGTGLVFDSQVVLDNNVVFDTSGLLDSKGILDGNGVLGSNVVIETSGVLGSDVVVDTAGALPKDAINTTAGDHLKNQYQFDIEQPFAREETVNWDISSVLTNDVTPMEFNNGLMPETMAHDTLSIKEMFNHPVMQKTLDLVEQKLQEKDTKNTTITFLQDSENTYAWKGGMQLSGLQETAPATSLQATNPTALIPLTVLDSESMDID